MSLSRWSAAALAAAVLSSAPLAAQARAASAAAAATVPVALPTRSAAQAVRLAGTAPVIDGRADDAAWRAAPAIDQFLEYEPNTGAEPRFRTELRVLYDDRYLYILGRMYDPAPDSIISLLSRRDVRTESEQLKLVIDSYHDRRTAYQFILNPAGVKRDFYVYNDQVEDPTWDAVWDGMAGIDSLGWVAEFRIPFSQMRFADLAQHTFGLLAVRDIARTRQRLSWPLLRRDVQGYVSQAGEVSGIGRLPQPRRLEILPYSVTKNVTRPAGAGWAHPFLQTVGADVKYGLSSNLTLDATINPDFGQVEADPAVLNLTAFEQFFEERRPFFLEGAGIFDFRTNCGDIDEQCTGLFYSRRIGRAPQLGGLYADPANPTTSRIVGAGKLSGRFANGFSIGVLDAVSERETGAGGRTIEPQTNYAVVRGLQEVRKGQGGIGFMLTAVNRQLDGDTRDFLRAEAYTGGVDLRQRMFAGNYELQAMVSGSLVRGSAAAIAATQRNGVHNYQRGDDGLTYDPARTALGGDAQRVSFSKFGGGITRFQTVWQRYSPGYETNDLGFQSRADEHLWRNWYAFQFQQPTRYYRRGFVNLNSWMNWTDEGLLTQFGFNTNSHFELPSTHWLHFGINGGPAASFDDRAARGGEAFRRAAWVEGWAGWEGDVRRTWTPNFFGGMWRGDEWRSRGWWINPGMTLRAGSRFNASLAANVNHARNDTQWFENYGDVTTDTAHVTFAELDQWTVGITSRLNFTATRNLSIQLYAQPFVSVGDFREWKELGDARSRDYDARFIPYGGGADPGGFNFKQLRTNTVVRWEYRPGSVLFVVWQQGRDRGLGAPTDFSFRRDFGDLFALHPDNTLLVKWSYWINP
ncbi:MAG: carbohydrate binding family 9 domain-containing protein [Gemmatimonadaceae bacterium]|nr:carbohydrate binding family 9 domain-containing protein [Gemmatimonadaceae bacterium]